MRFPITTFQVFLFLFCGFIGISLFQCLPKENNVASTPPLSAAIPDSTRVKWYQQQRQNVLAVSANQPSLALTQTLDILEQETVEDSITAKWYVLAVYLYSLNNEYEKAIELSEKAIELLQRYHCRYGFASCYNNLGYGLYKTGEYSAAVRYLQLAYQTLPLERQAAYSHKACANLALSYSALGEYERAEDALRQGESDGWMPPEELALHRGIIARDRGLYSEALRHFKQAGDSDEIRRFSAFCLAAIGRYSEAENIYKKALRTAQKEQKGDDYGKILWYLADLSQRKGDHREAIRGAENCITFLTQQRDTSMPLSVFSPAERLEWLIQAYRLKADSRKKLYDKSKQHNELLLAAQDAQTAIHLADTMYNGFQETASAVEMRDRLYGLYEQMIQILLEQMRWSPQNALLQDQILALVEQSKAFALRASLNESTAEQRLLPNEIFLQRKNLRARLTRFQRDNQPDSILTVQTALRRSDAAVQHQYPALAALRRTLPSVPGMEQLKRQLGPEDALLEWFAGDSMILGIAVTRDESRFFTTRRTPALNAILSETGIAISGKNGHPDLMQYAASASALFSQLMRDPVLFFREKGIHRLNIAPDGILWQIPFEALPETARPTARDFLADDFQTGYSWSGSMWLAAHTTQLNTIDRGGYAGFAPFYPPDDVRHLPDLPAARSMVQQGADYFKGRAWLNESATKQTFLTHSPDAAILHLAMHGTLNMENPLRSGLAFYNEKNTDEGAALLTAAEVYNLELNVPLVVLSACNTGSGNIRRGEGVMSLARAFTSAGCDATAMTSWSVPDEATADLVKLFMQHLQQGKRKDEALAAAKVAFLNDPKWIDFHHPYYWAGLIITGDVHPVEIHAANNYRNWVISAGILAVLVFFYVRKRKK